MRKFVPGVLLSLVVGMIIALLISHGSCLLLKNKLVYRPRLHKGQVQVSPRVFMPYERYTVAWDLKYGSFTAVHVMRNERPTFYQKDAHFLRLTWKGRDMLWVGLGIPISLREYNDRLYMVVFDRETDFSEIRFRYYKQAENTFFEIAPGEYPREVAVQNLWLSDPYEIEAIRKLDPNDAHFRRSLTAKIWYQLQKEKEYYEVRDHAIDVEFLEEYLRKYNVQKLDVARED